MTTSFVRLDANGKPSYDHMAELRAALAAATPRPWKRGSGWVEDADTSMSRVTNTNPWPTDLFVERRGLVIAGVHRTNEADATLIVEAVNNAEALLDRIAALEKVADALNAADLDERVDGSVVLSREDFERIAAALEGATE